MRLFVLLLVAFFGACFSTSSPQPEAPAVPVTYAVSKDSTKLGTIKIIPGSFGDFTPSDAPEAAALKELWEKTKAQGSVAVDMHMPTKGNKRGAYGTRLYRPGDNDFAQGVQSFLLSNDYSVEVVSTP